MLVFIVNDILLSYKIPIWRSRVLNSHASPTAVKTAITNKGLLLKDQSQFEEEGKQGLALHILVQAWQIKTVITKTLCSASGLLQPGVYVRQNRVVLNASTHEISIHI